MIHTRITLEALADRVLYAWDMALGEARDLLTALAPEIHDAILQCPAVAGMTLAGWLVEREMVLGRYTRQEA